MIKSLLLAGSGFFCEDSRPFCPQRGHSPNGGASGGTCAFFVKLKRSVENKKPSPWGEGGSA